MYGICALHERREMVVGCEVLAAMIMKYTVLWKRAGIA
jgi:hypothetical protein